jgi:hypothetical protein
VLRLVVALVVLAGSAALVGQSTSKWVYVGGDNRLHYASDARGNRIMDFSHAGYKGGGVTPPRVRAARTLPARLFAQLRDRLGASAHSRGDQCDGRLSSPCQQSF